MTTEDWETHQSRSIGEIKRMLREVIETQKLHSQRFETQMEKIDRLEFTAKRTFSLLEEILVILERLMESSHDHSIERIQRNIERTQMELSVGRGEPEESA